MKMTLARIVGQYLSKIANRETVYDGMVVEHVNQAVQQIHLEFQAAWNEKPWGVTYQNLEANKTVYDLKPEVGRIMKLERLDKGSRAIPVVRVSLERDDLELSSRAWGDQPVSSATTIYDASFSYVELPGRQIRIVEPPNADLKDGLRFLHFPLLVARLENRDDVPPLPEEIHECVIAYALGRAGQTAGIQFVNPKGVEQYRGEWHNTLMQFIYPPGATPSVIDEESMLYEEVT